RQVIERAPKHLAAHEKLYRILLDEGDTGGARTSAMQYVALLEEKGDRDAISTVQNEFTSRGQSLAVPAGAPKRTPTMERPAPAPAAAPPPPPPAPASEELSLEIETPAEEVSEGLRIPEVEETPAAAMPEMTFEPSAELSLGGEAPAEEQPFFGVEAVASPDLELPVEEPVEAEPPPPPPPKAAAPPKAPPAKTAPVRAMPQVESDLLSA